jgi:hypothetical protein
MECADITPPVWLLASKRADSAAHADSRENYLIL